MEGEIYRKFSMQRDQAGRRGIVWNLSFKKWLQIWENSGQLANRGCSRGKFCMARNGDEGPYSEDNVKIIPCEQNARDSALKYMALRP